MGGELYYDYTACGGQKRALAEEGTGFLRARATHSSDCPTYVLRIELRSSERAIPAVNL